MITKVVELQLRTAFWTQCIISDQVVWLRLVIVLLSDSEINMLTIRL